LKRSAEDLLSHLEPTGEALDSVQGDGSSMSDAVAAWKQLQLLTEFHQIWHIVHHQCLTTWHEKISTSPHVCMHTTL